MNLINAPDTSGLKEPESVRTSQESVLKGLQQYTLSHYPDLPSKFGELLLRIPELERTSQVFLHAGAISNRLSRYLTGFLLCYKVGKEMLSVKREGDGPGFNLLMELLRGDH